MQIINYKKHDIVLDTQSNWNSKKRTGGNTRAKIYKNDHCIYKMNYFYYKKNEIIQMLKQVINERTN